MNPGFGRNADPPAESRTTEDTHGTAVSILAALARGAGCAGRVDKSIPDEMNLFFSPFSPQGLNPAFFHLHLIDTGRKMDLNPFSQEKSFHHRLHGGDIIQGGMRMTGEFNPAMKTILIDQMEDFPTSHGDHLLGGAEAAVVAHDSPDQAGSQQHVRPFNQKDLGALFAGG